MQITVTWGWVDGRPSVRQRELKKKEKAAKEVLTKKQQKKKWGTKLPGLIDTKMAVAKKQDMKKHLEVEPIPPGNWPSLHLLIADHFQWDA